MEIDLIAPAGLLARPLFAYVDPGIVGTFYQMIYVAIFGVIAAVVFKPWGFIRAQFRRVTGRRPAGDAEAVTPDPTRRDDGTR